MGIRESIFLGNCCSISMFYSWFMMMKITGKRDLFVLQGALLPVYLFMLLLITSVFVSSPSTSTHNSISIIGWGGEVIPKEIKITKLQELLLNFWWTTFFYRNNMLYKVFKVLLREIAFLWKVSVNCIIVKCSKHNKGNLKEIHWCSNLIWTSCVMFGDDLLL